MEQLNHDLPRNLEENPNAAVNADTMRKNSPLLDKVRSNFGIFGGISLIFGAALAFLFYKTDIGVNYTLFTVIMVALLTFVMKKLEVPIKKATIACYIAAILLGLSSFLTSSEVLQFFNTVGILLLLDLSLLHQFHDDSKWDFLNYFGRMCFLFFVCIGAIGKPFADGIHYLTKVRIFKNSKIRNVLIGLVIAIPLLLVIVALLSSADLLFGKMTQNIFNFLLSSDIFFIIDIILFGFFACYCILCGSLEGAGVRDIPRPFKKADPEIAITIFGLLGLVYVLFCGIQIMYLFSNGLFVLPQEFTFAEYARRGFFELLAVTIINVALMLICTAFFRENKVLRIILTVITIGTYIMIGSAVYRMLLYIGAYNLTFLRLFVLLFLLIDALVLAGVILYVYNKSFPLFAYCVTVVSVCYLMFSFAKPDYFIAYYHVNNKGELTTQDLTYLTTDISMDAAPVLLPKISDGDWLQGIKKSSDGNYDRYIATEDVSSSIAAYYQRINIQNDRHGVRDFNLSTYLASRYVKQNPQN